MLKGGDMDLKDGGSLGLIHMRRGDVRRKRDDENPCTSARKMSGLQSTQAGMEGRQRL